jgi:hypothetical protein
LGREQKAVRSSPGRFHRSAVDGNLEQHSHFFILFQRKCCSARYRIRKASCDLWGREYKVKKDRHLPEEKIPKLPEMVVELPEKKKE